MLLVALLILFVVYKTGTHFWKQIKYGGWDKNNNNNKHAETSSEYNSTYCHSDEASSGYNSTFFRSNKTSLRNENTKLRSEQKSRESFEEKEDNGATPVSVNYHFTRRCNYSCKFCFHTAKTSFVLPLETAKYGLKLIADAGMKKINFSGGEPFLENKGRYVGELAKYCKEELELDSVSIVSNGSLIKENWFQQYGSFIDILAVSCDSFSQDTNKLIGRQQGRKCHLESLHNVRDWCHKYKVAFKLNTVVNIHNKDEDMIDHISQLNPIRWKVFQCLVLGGENSGPGALRDAQELTVSNAEFNEFLKRHKHMKCLVPESNEQMQNSYLILDEYMRFLDCTHGNKTPSKSILDVGVHNALLFSGFDERMFFKRGGKYVWSKADMTLDW